ncbi:MAG: hypothetical protein WCJ99_15085, partial [Betaproteobacteria bacterium]
ALHDKALHDKALHDTALKRCRSNKHDPKPTPRLAAAYPRVREKTAHPRFFNLSRASFILAIYLGDR